VTDNWSTVIFHFHIEPSWSASLYLTSEARYSVELFRVVAVKHWAKFVSLFLIVLTLIVIVAPYFDLPPTVARASKATQKILLAVFIALIPSITLLPQNFLSALAQVMFPGSDGSTTRLIDFNCARLC